MSGGLARLGCTAAAAAAPAAAVGPAAAALALSWRRPYSTEAAESWESMRAGFSTIQAEVEAGVAVLTVARPEALNALNKQARPVMPCIVQPAAFRQACMLLVATICGRLCSCKALSQPSASMPLSCLPQAMQKLVPRSQRLCRCNNISPSTCLVAMPAMQVMQELVSACLFLDRNHPTAKVIIVTGSGTQTHFHLLSMVCAFECTGSGRQPGLVLRRCILLHLEL